MSCHQRRADSRMRQLVSIRPFRSVQYPSQCPCISHRGAALFQYRDPEPAILKNQLPITEAQEETSSWQSARNTTRRSVTVTSCATIWSWEIQAIMAHANMEKFFAT